MKLTEIKGIGEKSKNALESKGIFSCEELARVLPSSFKEISAPVAFYENAKAITIKVQLLEDPKTAFVKGITITRAKVQDLLSGRVITLTWFNQRFAAKAYKKDEEYVVFGSSRLNDFTVSLAKKTESELVGMYPSYKKTGIKQKVLSAAIIDSIEKCGVESIIPNKIAAKHNLASLEECHKICNTSKNKTDLAHALERIEVERAVSFLLQEGSLRLQSKCKRKPLDCSMAGEIVSCLPYNLTNSQKSAVNEIVSDLYGGSSMNRLVMGEVGSGKTLVAFIAALLFVKNGYQVAFMAPTEILAKQHYNSFNKYFGGMAKSLLVTSSIDGKKQILKEIENGAANLIFGTHILSGAVKFNNLGLCVIDEQQRFGVEARALLAQKSTTGDILSLSATPIPRSVLLSLSGVLSATKMEGRPFAFNAKTYFVGKDKENDMWQYVGSQNKAFVICPRIDEEESEIEADSDSAESVDGVTRKLQKLFGKEQVVRVDGSLQKEQQTKAMQSFSTSKAKIMVATSVVEVGVDVSDASTMVILGANKFGLSSLHQLRGRIGRNGADAHCFILLPSNLTVQAKERLDFFRTHTSGFEIAEYDFKTRGAGDAFGTKQSGEVVLPFSSKVLELSKQIVKEIGGGKSKLIASN